MDAVEFEMERPRLTSIATRIVGSAADADDAVQEAWLRFSRTDQVDDPAAWLTTVVTRLCIDCLRKRRTRLVAEGGAGSAPGAESIEPESDAVLADSLGGAMQIVLETLVPAERAAFILHDVFGYSFAEIGKVLGRSDVAVRQLASRARRKVEGVPEPAVERAVAEENRRVVEAFLAAARGGDLPRLLSLLAPDAVMTADSAGRGLGSDSIYSGAAAVGARLNGAQGANPVVIDGNLGAAWIVKGLPKVAFLFRVEAGVVTAIELIADPDVLSTMEIAPSET